MNFHICTIVNDMRMYQEMRESFNTAGFSEPVCRFTIFDNSQKNEHEPFQAIASVLSDTREPYLIFCHQDLLLNKGADFSQLVSELEQLEKIDSSWLIAGNAGVTDDYQVIARVSDFHSTPLWTGPLPQPVHTLDECFLVFKTGTKLTCSKGMKGFHFYGADLCLNALALGGTCYVIDFHLTHLGSGNRDKTFYDLRDELRKRWSNSFTFGYAATTCSFVFLSRFEFLHRLFNREGVFNRLKGANRRLSRLTGVRFIQLFAPSRRMHRAKGA